MRFARASTAKGLVIICMSGSRCPSEGGVLGIAGDEQHLEVRAARRGRSASWRPFMPGRPTSVTRRSIRRSDSSTAQAGRAVDAPRAPYSRGPAAPRARGPRTVGVVLDDAAPSRPPRPAAAASPGSARRRSSRVPRWRGRNSLHARAPAEFRVDLDVAVRLLDEAVDHRQPEARALADRLGGEERIEGAGDHVGRHAGAGVGDGEHDILARPRPARAPQRPRRASALAVSIVSRPPSGMASRRVDGEVQQRVLELVRDRRASATGPAPTRLAGRSPSPSVRRSRSSIARDQRIDIDRLGLERLAAREGEQPVRQGGGPVGRRHGEPGIARGSRRCGPGRPASASVPASR